MTMANRVRLLGALAVGLALTGAGAVTASAAVSAGAAPGSARPAVGPVPAGFQPDSFTFVSANDGWVLGTAPCTHKPCTSVVRTTNGGRSWVGIPAPLLGLSSFEGQPGLDRIRFADNRDGFAYGSQLWVTHSGGARWARVRQGPGYIGDLEASDGVVYADSIKSDRITVYRSPAGANSWHRVARLPVVRGVDGFDAITLHGKSAWIILGGRVYASSNGTAWARESFRCPQSFGISSVAAYSSTRISLLCAGNAALGSTEKVLYASSDGGKHYVRAGQPPRGGDGGVLAEPTPSHLFVATTSGASWIYVSRNGGGHWTRSLTLLDGGKSWNDFGFTTASQGAAVEGTPAFGSRMFLTKNGGASWHVVKF
jgi:photosystem II stability/assembly factor-like uncharacterized protein